MAVVLHFADAHIDMANFGRQDPETGLPIRVMDFLRSLDEIIDMAIQKKVDLVLFAGDAYKNRSPAPTFQREWGKRIMRLSRAEIPTLLLIGNHDLSPALGRANALEAFDTLDVPHVRVLEKPCFLSAEALGLPLQVIAIPWISRAGMIAHLNLLGTDLKDIYDTLEEKLRQLIENWLDEEVDPALPVVLTAHATVEGASYGGERSVILGRDMGLSGSLVKDSRLDYVALGHIHKPQNLNEGEHPPVVYPGSIERIDFGEVKEEKYFVIADVQRGSTSLEWHKLANIRPFIDRSVKIESDEQINQQIEDVLPADEELKDAIFRLTIEYPRDWEAMIDEGALRERCAPAFDFRLVKRPQVESRIRLPDDQNIGSLSPLELLEKYWQATHTDPDEVEQLSKLAAEIIASEEE